MASVSDSLMDAILVAVRALNLSLPGADPVQVVKRKLPAATESVDNVPLICVVPWDRAGKDEPFDSGDDNTPEGRRYREYQTQIVVIAPGDLDNITWLSDYQTWRRRISRRFGMIDPLPGIVELMITYVEPDAVIDRKAHSALYDYSAVGLRLGCVEPAGPD